MKKLLNTKSTIYTKAFTLIEILVVISIIALLSSIIMNNLAEAKMKSNDTKIAEDLRQFRIAIDMYFNDNQEYPPTVIAANYPDIKTVQKNNWSNKLAFFAKTAEAGTNHSITKLCVNFDNIANSLVQRKYMPAVPVHPYDNDANGVCYKAVKGLTTKSFSSYGVLTTQVSLNNGGTMFKRTGFVVGDISKAGIQDLISVTKTASPAETPYPAGADGGEPFASNSDVMVTVDRIYGVTSGITNTSCESNGQVYDSVTKTCRTLFPGPRVNSLLCFSGKVPDPYSDNCITSSTPPATVTCSGAFFYDRMCNCCIPY